MAIDSSVKIQRLRNSVGRRAAHEFKEPPTEAQFYVTDHSQRLGTNTRTINPVYDYLSRSGNPGHQDHVYPYVNKFKTLEIAVTGMTQTVNVDDEKRWGNWRTMNLAGVKVSPHIYLQSEESKFEFSFSNEVKAAWETLKSQGVLSKITQVKEMGAGIAMMAGKGAAINEKAGGKMISKYEKAPAWVSSSPIKMSTSLKLKFQFGQYGIFSGEHEVVRPILALASLFAPSVNGKYYRGIAPTPPVFMLTYLKKLAENVFRGKDMGEMLKGYGAQLGGSSGIGGFAAEVVNIISDIEERLIEHNENVIDEALKTFGSRGLMIRKGRFAVGPFVVKDVNWDYDFTEVDEFGFPYAGSVTFSGLEGVFMISPWEIVKNFKLISTTPDNQRVDGIYKFASEDSEDNKENGFMQSLNGTARAWN